MNKGGSTPSIPNPWEFKVGGNGSTIHVDSDLDNISVRIPEIGPIIDRLLVDAAVSGVLDTLLLPYTIYKQQADGSIEIN